MKTEEMVMLELDPSCNSNLASCPGCCGPVVPNEGSQWCMMKDAQVQDGWSMRAQSLIQNSEVEMEGGKKISL